MTARNAELEAKIAANPDDESIKLVYGDWLQARGDSWGELISNQPEVLPSRETALFAWDDPAGTEEAISEEPTNHELFDSSGGTLSHREQWANPSQAEPEASLRAAIEGELLEGFEPKGVRFRWHRGFLEELFVPQHGLARDRLAEALEQLLSHRAVMSLTSLALGEIEWLHGEDKWNQYALHYQRALDVLVKRRPPALRRLVLGAWEEHDISWTAIGDLSALWAVLPGLRELELQGNGMDLGEIKAPNLERLLIRSGGLPPHALRSIELAELPKLTELTLWFGESDYGGSSEVEAALPFLINTRPMLRRLGLANAIFADELCSHIAAAPILAQLTHLDLSLGTMTEAGARVLLEHREAFAHIRHLDLRGNALPAAECEQLSTLCASVDVRFQKSADWRYVTVGE